VAALIVCSGQSPVRRRVEPRHPGLGLGDQRLQQLGAGDRAVRGRALGEVPDHHDHHADAALVRDAVDQFRFAQHGTDDGLELTGGGAVG
jgi:hypothetical protein